MLAGIKPNLCLKLLCGKNASSCFLQSAPVSSWLIGRVGSLVELAQWSSWLSGIDACVHATRAVGSKAGGQQSRWGGLGVQCGVIPSQTGRRFASHHFPVDRWFFDGKSLGTGLIPLPTHPV